MDAERTDIYTTALAAVQRHPGAISDGDRQAVADFLEHTEDNEGRIRYFVSRVSMQAVLHHDEDAAKVTDALRAIVLSLRSFVKGQPIPEELRVVVARYVQYWLDLAQQEARLLGVLRSALAGVPEDVRRRLREGD
ncbi:MAG: hypothetical protein QOE22_679 [Candidatus Parcubacteria bacterium]|jgi:hypothetical protein|nr:hypothetical protein [Candidatus Parcubacteria bacterium]